MANGHIPDVAVAPAGERAWLADAVVAAGGRLVPLEQAEALVWTAPADPDGLAAALAAGARLRWVQLPWAGIEPYVHLLDPALRWTCGKGVYAQPVAELALALGLAGLRAVAGYARASSWGAPEGRMLFDGRVTILGGGGIARELVGLLAPWRTEVTIVRKRPTPIDGVARVVGPEQLIEAVARADLVVVALALTPETTGVIDASVLEAMADHAWLVNVGRGAHVVTDDLVDALRDGAIGGAGLDVTDPEPLPEGHPLWSLPSCVITPHVGNTPEMAVPLLSARIAENVRRWSEGRPLLGVVDPALGY